MNVYLVTLYMEMYSLDSYTTDLILNAGHFHGVLRVKMK